MTVVTTYPGVYIQELPSNVHTITGVATSIAAFIGYTDQGPVDTAIPIFSPSDYERSFGGLTIDSPLSYAVNQFFQNGGSQAYVVRIADGAESASITLAGSDQKSTIVVTAASDGTWGNYIQLDVDYKTTNPDSLFNLTVTQFSSQGGNSVPVASETYRNLSMSTMNPNYFLWKINGVSQLISVDLDPSLKIANAFTDKGYSQSGALAITALTANQSRVAISVDGGTAKEFDIFTGAPPNAATVPLFLAAVQTSLQSALTAAYGAKHPTVSVVNNEALKVTSSTTDQTSSIQFFKASTNDACNMLKLGIINGGFEVEGAAISHHPVTTGTLTTQLPDLKAVPAAAKGTVNIDLYQAGSTTPLNGNTPIPLPIWGAGTATPNPPTTLSDLVANIQTAFDTAGTTQTLLKNTKVEQVTLQGNPQIRIVPDQTTPNKYYKFSNAGADTTADYLTLTFGKPETSYNRYKLGSGTGNGDIPYVKAAAQGDNGNPPTAIANFGDPLAKTGIYALDNVDIFNIMFLPDVADGLTNLADAIYTNAVTYCALHRAMLIVDLPQTITTIAGAQNWLTQHGVTLPNDNAVAYFPRIMASDPLRNGNIFSYPNGGAIAGIWARTDAQRGVWKAPAGTETQVNGARGFSYRMNDMENGVLNPLGLNCLRTFPVTGNVVWGARTMRGADQLDDPYKYVPVRRLTYFLEESLFRGSQWVVFEPNDEPLWAQIRLTITSFMNDLFRQRAFAGSTPQEAFFVRCDKETTTPLDQMQGRVNIIVGFAPLYPAEFVIIQIQQISNLGPT